MHLEFAQDVLDVRPRGLRADDEGPSDRVVVRALGEQRQDLPLSGRQTSDPLEAPILVTLAAQQVGEQRTEHPRRHERVAVMDRLRGLDQLRERRLPRQVPTGAGIEDLDQAPVVLSCAQHQDLTLGYTSLDGGGRPGTVRHREIYVEDRHVGQGALRFRDGLEAVPRLGHDVDLGFALEDRPHRLTEQRMSIGQEDPDAVRSLRQSTLSLRQLRWTSLTLPTTRSPGTHRKPYWRYGVRMRAVMPIEESVPEVPSTSRRVRGARGVGGARGKRHQVVTDGHGRGLQARVHLELGQDALNMGSNGIS